MDPVNKAIWDKFHVKHGDILPFSGWEGTRDTLAQLFYDLGYTKGAEIGVQRGAYSRTLLKSNPNLHLLCIDSWAPFTHHSQAWQDAQLERARKRLRGMNCEFIVKTSLDAAKEIPDGSLDFVYIDALHDFDSVMSDMIAWSPKVRRDGIVSGHDYFISYTCGVIPAVDAFARAHNISMYYVTPKDIPRSWFWRKI
jgi:hypothetical protein